MKIIRIFLVIVLIALSAFVILMSMAIGSLLFIHTSRFFESLGAALGGVFGVLILCYWVKTAEKNSKKEDKCREK